MSKIKLKVTDSTADGYKLTVDGRQFPNDRILRSTVTIEPWQPVTLHLDILLDELDTDIQKFDININPLVDKEIKESRKMISAQDKSGHLEPMPSVEFPDTWLGRRQEAEYESKWVQEQRALGKKVTP